MKEFRKLKQFNFNYEVSKTGVLRNVKSKKVIIKNENLVKYAWNKKTNINKEFICIEINKIFKTSYEAAIYIKEYLNLNGNVKTISNNIRKVLNNKKKLAYGFHFTYLWMSIDYPQGVE